MSGGIINTGSTPRLLQLGLDKEITHFANQYMGAVDKIFQTVDATKGFYEIVQLAGMGLASRKDEGDDIVLSTINQDGNARFPIYTYSKSARVTMEAIEDNQYENMLSLIAQSLVKSHKANKDYQGATILNNCTSTTWMDGQAMLSTAHPIYEGGTSSNRLSPDLDLSEDALEQAILLIDNFMNPDGLIGDYSAKQLVVPTALRFTAERIMKSRFRTSTTDNDIHAINSSGAMDSDYVIWKRLSSNATWFVTTTCPNGLLLAERKGIVTKTFNDDFTFDTIATSFTRFRTFMADWRCIAGSVGP